MNVHISAFSLHIDRDQASNFQSLTRNNPRHETCASVVADRVVGQDATLGPGDRSPEGPEGPWRTINLSDLGEGPDDELSASVG